MKKTIFLLCLLLTSCATWEQQSAYDQTNIDYYMRIADQEKNPVAPTGRNFGETFSCYMKYSAYFDQADTRFICD